MSEFKNQLDQEHKCLAALAGRVGEMFFSVIPREKFRPDQLGRIFGSIDARESHIRNRMLFLETAHLIYWDGTGWSANEAGFELHIRNLERDAESDPASITRARAEAQARIDAINSGSMPARPSRRGRPKAKAAEDERQSQAIDAWAKDELAATYELGRRRLKRAAAEVGK